MRRGVQGREAVSGMEAGDAAPLLQVEHLTTSFPGTEGRPLLAVDDVSLSLDRGRTLAVVGESGSGKSLLARSIMGILPSQARLGPASRVLLNGRPVVGPGAARGVLGRDVAMVFQNPMTSLNPVRRIGRQLTDPLRLHVGLGRREATERACDLLATVGIPAPRRRLRQYPHQMSGGMRQRVAIAAALSCQPSLLIADEPTTALDVTVQREILDLLGRLQEQFAMGVILISHDLGLVRDHSHRTMVMYAGRIVEDAPTERLFDEVRHPYTRGLLASMPRIDDDAPTRLATIGGLPPDLAQRPEGCSFAPRCPRAAEDCRQRVPALEEHRPGHTVACLHPVTA